MNAPARKTDNHEDHMHGFDVSNERLSDLPFDELEIHFLTLARLFFLTFHRPERHGWISAFRCAQDYSGARKGPLIAKSVLDVVDAMQRVRGSGFSYCDPFCKGCRVVCGVE